MPQITKTVDKQLVNGSEIFIYTINAAYSGLTIPNQEGKIIDIIPNKIKYVLPPVGGQIESITEVPVQEGTQITFNLGTVNSGTSLSFTIACFFGPGRVDNDSYINNVDLIADEVVLAKATAPVVNLKLDENFILTKSAQPSNVINAGDEVTFILSLTNNNNPGAEINNVIIQDILPPQFTPITTFTPVGNDMPSDGYSDPTANGAEGSWSGNTLTFNLQKYNGVHYDITFKAKVSESVTTGENFVNTGKWTMNGESRKDAPLILSIYDPSAVGFKLEKYGGRNTIIGAPINYTINNDNAGNVTLSNYELEDIIPSEIDITAFRLRASTGLVNYNIYVALASNDNVYIPVVTNVMNGSYPYQDLTPFIPEGDRVAKIKLTAQNLLVSGAVHCLYIYGITNSSAIMGSSFTNKAVATSGDISQIELVDTLVSDGSELHVNKEISPVKSSYNPLDEFNVILEGSAINSISINPILADLLPDGLHYVVDSEYFLYYDDTTQITYDSRQPDFPVITPSREIIPNFENTDSTLIRWSFDNFILKRLGKFQIIFKVFVGINESGTFVNKGYMGVSGDNTIAVYDKTIDTLDIDGDGLTTDEISCKEASGIILTTSEFVIKKITKGQNDLEYSSSAVTVEGGNVDFQLQITNNQLIDLKNIEIIDILPYIGDTGVMLADQQRGSQFDVYATSIVTAQIVNVIGEHVDPNPDITIEYSTSNDPKRFDELGNPIGTEDWSLIPPEDITRICSVKVTTGPNVILHPYDRLIIKIEARAPVGTPVGKIAYNSYAVRGNKITSSGTEPLLPTEPNKVEVTIDQNERGSIGDFVWFDLNENGLYDQGELGVNGVTVELYDGNKNLLKTTVTANDFNGKPGYYLFTDLADGVYQIKFIPTESYLLTKPQSGYPNGSKPDEITGMTSYITMSNAQHIMDIDAGIINKVQGSIGDFVWEDLNSNGNYDLGEPGINGITVELYDTTGNLLKTTVTGNDEQGNPGYYLFEDLPKGNYKVKFIPTDEYLLTQQNTTESNGSKPNPSTGLTEEIILMSNTAQTDVDAGIVKCNLRQQAITDIFESVALEQSALSHILNAEGEKIQKANSLNLSLDDILSINNSVEDMISSVVNLEMILQEKLKLFQHVACCLDDCCDF